MADLSQTTVCQCLGGSTHATPEGRLCDLCGGIVQDQPAPQTTIEGVLAKYRAKRMAKPSGWWRCTHCGNVETYEREVMCWRCSKGEMNYVSR